jgi:hypothetical protein
MDGVSGSPEEALMRSARFDSARSIARRWYVLVASVAPLLAAPGVAAQVAPVRVVTDASGSRLQVDGRDFMVLGMNWDYFPIGTTYTYSLWNRPDDVIRDALDREMPLLRAMGVNAIRQYVGVPPRWVRYIYEQYGIYTVLNHALGRYGVTVDGVFVQSTDYSDPQTRAVLTAEVLAMVDDFRDVPGVLMWLLGNENNYGLTWSSAETEALPEGEREAARARHLYSLVGEVARAIKQRDPNRPVALANGDVQYIDLIAEESKGLDVFGANAYRGASFGDLFQVVKDKLGLPVMFTEFGSDAWNAREGREDQRMQARYLIANWREIYEQSAGKGLAGNSIGGFTFQWSDGWWKFGQEDRLDVQDLNASWPNGGYTEDYVAGRNNMNEEWWGITAKGRPDARGLFTLYPRAAYYALQRAYTLAPYGPGTDLGTIRAHFGAIDPAAVVLTARGDQAALATDLLERVRVKDVRIDLRTYSTGGTSISTPRSEEEPRSTLPSFLGFDHLESFYAGLEVRPTRAVTGTVEFNVLGNVPVNPIDEIFYENRGRQRTVVADSQALSLESLERVKVYRASASWDADWFSLEGFYRTGHYHWGYEGDFFGLYREANYGPNIDIYNAAAPLGLELTGKQALSGTTIAFGPELWWGANPAILAKQEVTLGTFTATGIYQEDIARQSARQTSSLAIPLPPTRKATIHLATSRGPVGIELGGIWSGSTKEGERFQIADGEPGNYRVLEDTIRASDAFGGKIKLTVSKGRYNWYAQGAAMGLVADGGPTSALTYTGWWLKDSGNGNQWNVLTGLAVTLGNFQVAPNFLWQKPIVGPVPADVPAPGRPRNVLDDPFAVRANREMIGGELLITYDPTPATWMYSWDSDVREDARLAASVGFVYRHLPTTQDAAIGVLANGTLFAFPGAPPAQDLWEAHARVVSKLGPRLGMVTNLFAGTGQANGSDARLIHRYGGDARVALGSVKFLTAVKLNDWGPYDYHRDFNLTFPLQLMGDVSYVLGVPGWFDLPQTSVGVRGTWRSLDQYSPRYCPIRLPDASGTLVCEPTAPGDNGSEWEIRTYLTISM